MLFRLMSLRDGDQSGVADVVEAPDLDAAIATIATPGWKGTVIAESWGKDRGAELWRKARITPAGTIPVTP